jgi:hypothetical protein
MTGISPERIDDPEYAGYAHRVCLDITLTPQEVKAIEDDMRLVAAKVYEWSKGALELQMSFTELPVDYAGFVAPDFVFGPFEVDDELLNPYVGVDTDFVYVVTGYSTASKTSTSPSPAGFLREMSIHGAGYANIQYGPACNSIIIDGNQSTTAHPRVVPQPGLGALQHQSGAGRAGRQKPDWSAWKRGSLPACGSALTGLTWFPSIDFCEWDPDWIDCNNTSSAGRCVHAGELDGEMSWYEHVIRAHYPKEIRFIGNYCRDGRQDVSETGVDSGWPCP